MLTLVTALAVTDGIREATGLEAAIKWPNDVVVKGKKVAGILTEMSTDLDRIEFVVIGIGIRELSRRDPRCRDFARDGTGQADSAHADYRGHLEALCSL